MCNIHVELISYYILLSLQCAVLLKVTNVDEGKRTNCEHNSVIIKFVFISLCRLEQTYLSKFYEPRISLCINSYVQYFGIGA